MSIGRRISHATGRLIGAVVVLLIIIAIVVTGYNSGFDDRIGPNGLGRYRLFFSAVLSKQIYGLPGYVYYEPVEGALMQAGLTDDPNILAKLGTKYPDNLNNADLINQAIQKASKLDITVPAPGQQDAQHGVRGFPGEDLGFVDFTKLAFRFFSPRIQSLFALYLTLFTGSVFLFWFAFRKSTEMITVLMLFCLAYLWVLTSLLFPGATTISLLQTGWITPVDPRFLTTLGVIPLVHVIATIARPTERSLLQIVALLGQAFILCFAIWIRASAYWTLLAVAAATIYLTCRDAYTVERNQSLPSLPDDDDREPRSGDGASRTGLTALFRRLGFAGTIRRYSPLLILFGVGLAGHLYTDASLHPLYRQGHYITHHNFWHDIYYSLQDHPRWNTYFAASHQINGHAANGDDVPIAGVLRYLANHPPRDPENVFDNTGSLYWGAIERLSFSAFWELAAQHPRFVLETFFVYKPKWFLVELKSILLGLFSGRAVFWWAALALLLVTAAYVMAQMSQQDWRRHTRFLQALLLCIPLTLLPNFATIVDWPVMPDFIFLGLATTFVLVNTALAAGLCFVSRKLEVTVEAH